MHGCICSRSSDSLLRATPHPRPGCGCTTTRSNPLRSWSQQADVMYRHIAVATPLMAIFRRFSLRNRARNGASNFVVGRGAEDVVLQSRSVHCEL